MFLPPLPKLATKELLLCKRTTVLKAVCSPLIAFGQVFANLPPQTGMHTFKRLLCADTMLCYHNQTSLSNFFCRFFVAFFRRVFSSRGNCKFYCRVSSSTFFRLQFEKVLNGRHNITYNIISFYKFRYC